MRGRPDSLRKNRPGGGARQRLDGEVVSADSMQIYQGMSIGTAKPAVEEMRGIPHHMIDFLSPKERFSVADYAAMARKAILDIHKRGRLPILAGGTGLYVQAVTEGILFQEEPENPEIRRRLERRAEEKGAADLFRERRRSIRRRRSELTGTMKNECSERLRFTISQEKP